MGIPSLHSRNNEYFPTTMTRIYSYFCIHFLTHKMTLWYTTPRSPFTILTIREMWFIHPQEKCCVYFSTKNKENLLLPKVYESKKTHVGIKCHQIYFSFWKNINWLRCLVKTYTQFCILLTGKSNCRNLFVFWNLLL